MMKEMTIKVFSRVNVEKFVTDLPHIVISIREPDSPGYVNERAKLPDNPNRIAELYLDFCDMDCRKTGPDKLQEIGYKLFSKDDAKAILSMVKITEPYINLIVVNCPGGISRSSGVAAALSILLKIPDGDNQYFNPKGPYTPNRFVYRTILDTAIEENWYAPETGNL